jgi:hypothetical protein
LKLPAEDNKLRETDCKSLKRFDIEIGEDAYESYRMSEEEKKTILKIE